MLASDGFSARVEDWWSAPRFLRASGVQSKRPGRKQAAGARCRRGSLVLPSVGPSWKGAHNKPSGTAEGSHGFTIN